MENRAELNKDNGWTRLSSGKGINEGDKTIIAPFMADRLRLALCNLTILPGKTYSLNLKVGDIYNANIKLVEGADFKMIKANTFEISPEAVQRAAVTIDEKQEKYRQGKNLRAKSVAHSSPNVWGKYPKRSNNEEKTR